MIIGSGQIQWNHLIEKYKLLHILCWSFLIIEHVIIFYDDNVPYYSTIFENTSVILIMIIPFYFTVYYVTPKYLNKKRIFAFLGWIVLQLFIMTSVYLIIFYIYYYTYYPDYFRPPHSILSLPSIIRNYLGMSWTFLIPLIFASAMTGIHDQLKSKNRLQKLKQEKLDAELHLLKNQFHPHFLFNVINNMYFMISSENKKAKKILELTSDMLRYFLYDSKGNYTTIEKEILYIENYVEILRLREINPPKFEIMVNKEAKSFKIAPLLLSPILENTLKHVSLSFPNIFIYLKVDNVQNVIFEIGNKLEVLPNDFETFTTEEPQLADLKKRLQILYPNNHLFDYYRDKNIIYSKLILYGISN